MSFTRPLGAARSDRQREREAVLRKTREVVRQRAGGRCEFPCCTAMGTDLAHMFRRGAVIGQPLCDHPTLCAWLCRRDHDLFDGRRKAENDTEAQRARELADDAAERALTAFGVTDEVPLVFGVDAVRWLEGRLRETGVIVGREWAE